MNLYAMAMLAWRTTDGEPRAHVTPGIVLANDEEDAQRRTLAAAFQHFPESEGWLNHHVGAVEVPPLIDLENYRLTWQIEGR